MRTTSPTLSQCLNRAFNLSKPHLAEQAKKKKIPMDIFNTLSSTFQSLHISDVLNPSVIAITQQVQPRVCQQAMKESVKKIPNILPCKS